MPIPPGQKPALDWRAVYDRLTPVQKLVFRKGRWTVREEDRIARDIYKWNKTAAEETLRHELADWGCTQTPQVGLSLAAYVRESAKRSGASVVNTYNYRLAHAIAQVGRDVPTANRATYLARLFTNGDAWARTEYGTDKAAGIAVTETYGTIGLVKELFYKNNRSLLDKMKQVVVRPERASCPVCQDAVRNGPYAKLSDAPKMPAHPVCPHFLQVVTTPDVQVKCAELWAGK